MRQYYVYILASKRNGVPYTGVTNDLVRRVHEHKHEVVRGFTSRYNVKVLVHYEVFGSIRLAIQREKNIKAWKRRWKVELIEKENREWNDLYEGLV
jgi:putative endonuclease